MSDQIVSIIRTVVPALVGLLITAAGQIGVDLDNAALTAVVSSIVIGAYYAAARQLERRWPKAGWLLGLPRAPTYPTG